jgi:hypothetical protein
MTETDVEVGPNVLNFIRVLPDFSALRIVLHGLREEPPFHDVQVSLRNVVCANCDDSGHQRLLFISLELYLLVSSGIFPVLFLFKNPGAPVWGCDFPGNCKRPFFDDQRWTRHRKDLSLTFERRVEDGVITAQLRNTGLPHDHECERHLKDRKTRNSSRTNLQA